MSTVQHLFPERHRVLVVDSARSSRVSALVWALIGGFSMYAMAVSISKEMADFPGGAEALATSVTPAVEAMRFLRWPGEHLETLGGYLWYHNVPFLNVLLAVYGAIHGVRAVRGGEERHVVEEILATGTARRALVVDRAAGFAVTCLVIALGLGVGSALGLAQEGEPDTYGALVTGLMSGLVTFVGFGVGLLASQYMSSARAAAAAASGVLVGLHVATNMGEELGPVSVLRFVSPFHYANESRAMVPGRGLDLLATAGLVALGVGLLWAAASEFGRRDYAGARWSRREAEDERPGQGAIPTVLLGSVWAASLRRGAVGLLAWSVGASVVPVMFLIIRASVMDVWAQLEDYMAITGAGPTTSMDDTLWSMVGDLTMPVLAGYVLVQASGWVNDLAQGRVEMILAGPVSWSRLVLERWVGLVIGGLLVTLVSSAVFVVGAAAVGAPARADGVLRTIAMAGLFLGALGGVASVVVVTVRRAVAVTVLAVIVGLSYLLTLLAGILDWPGWVDRLSVFWAVGHPYLSWAPPSGLAVLVLLAVGGTGAAALAARRTAKVS